MHITPKKEEFTYVFSLYFVRMLSIKEIMLHQRVVLLLFYFFFYFYFPAKTQVPLLTTNPSIAKGCFSPSMYELSYDL